MKRILSIFTLCASLLVLFAQASWAADDYTLTLGTSPQNAGYVSPSGSQQYASGTEIYVYTYSYSSSYRFKHWTANGTVVSTSSEFSYTMPSADVQLLAVYEYDPTSPPDPAADAGKKYTLTLISEPNNAGSFSYNSGKYEVGRQMWLYPYNREGFVFDKWIVDGEEKTDQSFYFTMPDHDVVAKAFFHYDPSSPADPEQAKLQYKVTLSTQPANAGYFNWSKETMVEAQQDCRIYAYPNSGYKFREWLQDGHSVSTDQGYSFKMPAEHLNLVAVFDYEPENPGNPNANYFDPESGEVIIDDFTPGNIYSAIDQVIGGYNNCDKVTMITVAGPISQYDWGVSSNYPNCTVLDLSRTYGMTSVPSWSFYDNSTLISLSLPQGIERIEYAAFYNCSNLTSISLHAITPPTIDDYAFVGVQAGLTVYVPAFALPLYMEADVWKDLEAAGTITILPLGDQVSALEVNLPESVDISLYKGMFIELINKKSGQRQRYVITDRTTYTFSSLVHNTKYQVFLKNAAGETLGEIEEVKIDDHDVSVTFENLMVPRTLKLTVKTPAGDDVTEYTTITWLDDKDTYLNKGAELAGQLDGKVVKYRISLPQTLGMQFVLPEETSYEVKEENDIVYTLAAIPTTTISGKVIDVKTDKPINGATVAISQMLNGLYSKSFTVKTNAQGEWSQQVFLAPTDVTVSMSEYISQSVTLTTEDLQTATAIPAFSLKDINGTAITLALTYTTVEGVTQDHYNDVNNVEYMVYNETAKEAVTEYNVQYPQIVLIESLPEGTELTITAKSKNDKFLPVSGKATVDANDRASVTLPVVQLGGIQATFAQTDNSSIVGILYNGDGRLIKKYDYANTALTISELTDGEYTLVTMANSQFFNSVSFVSQFADAGLREGVDYLKNKVTVQSGAYTTIHNPMVPFLDETKLYYTSGNTSVSVNRAQITVGNYLTLNSRVDFKNAYADQISDVRLQYTLPMESAFVANSVMAGNNTSAYTIDNQVVTVPLDNYGDRVRFCFIPTVGGSNAVTAAVLFKYNGKEMSQPIGSASYVAKNLSISIPPIASSPTVPVSGTGTGKADVVLYDNGVQVGQTTSLANGQWATTIELDNPYNLSTHNIYAKLTNQQGVEMQTETQSITYDVNAVQVSKVVMYHNNPEMNKTYEVVFDFLNPTTVAQKYTYYIYNKVFTFTIDFTSNDPEKIKNVVLNVKTGNGTWTPLKATFDQNKGKWIASGEFGNMYDGNIPLNVAVNYNYIGGKAYYENADVIENFRKNTGQEMQAELDAIDTQAPSIGETIDESTLDETLNALNSADNQLAAVLSEITDFDDDPTDYSNASEDELMQMLDECLAELESYDFSAFVNTPEDSEYGTFTFGDFVVNKSTCEGVTEESLLAEGYRKMDVNDEEAVYILRTENSYGYASLKENLKVVVSTSALARILRAAGEESHNAENAWNAGSLLAEKDVAKNTFKMKEGMMKGFKGSLGKFNKISAVMKAKNAGRLAVRLAEGRSALKNLLSMTKGAAKYGKYLKYGKSALKLIPFVDGAINIYQAYDKFSQLSKLMEKLEAQDDKDCDEFGKDMFESLLLSTHNTRTDVVFYYGVSTAAAHGVGLGVAAGAAACPPSVFVTVPAAVYAQYRADKWFDKMFDNRLSYIDYLIQEVNEHCKRIDESQNRGQESGCEDADPSIDPSGYVYEAVSSNRVQGATATAYYKEMVEDMYGDLHENIVVWDAEEYAQENPLFTDENGMYRWDVPQGLWQVKFEKEGYQTAYSEWLPVPPPQLEVNIPMTQMLQPTVKKIQVFPEGVDIEFDKYMDPETLTKEFITVTRNGFSVDGTIKLLNEEVTYEGETQTYASKIRFVVPENEPLTQTDDVKLTIKRNVKSYAGVPMEQDYTTENQLDVELMVTSVAADELVNIAYGGTRTITIGALPADAAKGKTLNITTMSSMIASIDKTQVVLDENGQAELVITGELPGSTILNFAVENTDVKSQTTVNVKDEALLITMAPRASRISGTQVYRGTKIQLTSETDNAVIYYTLDGSCPCEDTPGRMIYNPDQPIVIESDNVVIKALAVAPALEESEAVEFNYSLKKTNLNYGLPVGWKWISHNIETAVPVSEFVEGTTVDRILAQRMETVKDPSWGFVGLLTELEPATGYKVHQTTAQEKRLDGVEYNAVENTIDIKVGWNWIGYPLNQVMTVDEALTYFTATTGDYIIGQDGFAEYDGTEWVGTLEGLKPGQGYLFKSATSAAITFNTNIVSNAVSQVGKHNYLINSPWAYDQYGYANMMPVTAELYINGTKADDGEYTVGAFAGDECRGVVQWKNGRLLISVYGDKNEEIRFVAVDNNSERFYDVTEMFGFRADNMGSWYAPIALTLGEETTGMKQTYNDLLITPLVARDHITVSAGGRHISQLTITNMNGVSVIDIKDLGTGGVVTIGSLMEGVYIATVKAEGNTYYKKIVKANK